MLRYGRHLILPEVGLEGQKRLKQASVLLIGAGGLGSPAALYLAAAGVDRLGIVDFDKVDLTNLHRQVMHATRNVGVSKLESARQTLSEINPHCQLELHETLLSSENALEIMQGYDIIVDGTDNFPTRYLVNDACVLLGKVNMYGSIFRFDGQATVFCAPGGPCYRCLYPEPPPPGTVPSCAEGGVLGVLPGIIGVIQATEAVKWILGIGNPLVGRLVLYDALEMSFRELKIRRDPECPICGEHRTITQLIDYQQFCGIPKPSDSPEIEELSVEDLDVLMVSGESFVLIDVRESSEYAESRIPGSVLIPLGDLPYRLDELDRSPRYVMQCRSGMRSAKACLILQEAGFGRVQNLKGGILDWQAHFGLD